MSEPGGVWAVVVPPVPALLPEHAGLVDPLPGLREACDAAVRDLVAGAAAVCVLHDPLDPADGDRGVGEAGGSRVARALLAWAGWEGETVFRSPEEEPPGPGHALLVMASGSARRGEKAPGHLDERSFAFDDAVAAALATGDPEALCSLDARLGDDLLAAGVRCLHRLGERLAELPEARAGGPGGGEIRWSGDPFGVQYWVAAFGRAGRPRH